MTSTAVASVNGGIHSTAEGWAQASGDDTSFGTVNFRYRVDNQVEPPTVSITSPLDNSTFISPGNLLIEANASSGVTNVEFFADAVKLGEDSTPPYEYTWVNPMVNWPGRSRVPRPARRKPWREKLELWNPPWP